MANYLNTDYIEHNPFYGAVKSGYLYNPNIQGKMRAAAFMSGSGSNFKRIYQVQYELEARLGEKSPFEIVTVFTDTQEGYENAGKIISDVTGKVDTIPRIYLSPNILLEKKFLDTTDKVLKEKGRILYDENTVLRLREHNVNFAILAGYMRLLSKNLIQRVACINIHRGPLNVIDELTGKRKFTGDSAVKKQILAEREYLQSTVNVAREGADTGEILMLSKKSPLDLENHTIEELKINPQLLEEIINKNQNKLKEIGDLDIFPKVITFAANGLYRFNENGKVVFGIPKLYSDHFPEDVKMETYEAIFKNITKL